MKKGCTITAYSAQNIAAYNADRCPIQRPRARALLPPLPLSLPLLAAMKFGFVAVAVLAAAFQVSAQSLSVISTTFGGNGCPQGSSTTISVTSGAINYTPPSTFQALTGPGVPPNATRENCQIGHLGRMEVQPVTTSTPSGNSAQVTETYFFSSAAGVTATGTTTITTTGPTTANTPYSPTNVWSPCGGNAITNINTALRAVGSAAGSITIAGTINTPIIWEAC
ncbi:hypothetical protein NMY22_g14046 [Coprinellus aureogranulatus]|nr:hypothetical protein NMY22_g14046 [Coprinellus aureogranulatus]